MSDRSVRFILHSDLSFQQYKIQIVRQLSASDKEVRLKCHQLVLLLMNDEAHFHLSRTVNKQHFRHWSDHNPHELHKHSLYDPKVIVLRGVSAVEIIGP